MKRRLWYILKTYLLTVLIFIIAKVVFMLCYHAAHHFSPSDVAQVVGHGLSLDLSTALYFLIVPFLLTVAAIWLRIPRIVFSIYYAIVALAFALAFVADTSLYAFWGFKLDASCLDYLSTPTEAMASVTTLYLLVRLVVLLVATAAIWYAYHRLCGTPLTSLGLNADEPRAQCRRAVTWLEPLLYVVMIPVIIIGIRGG